MLSIVMLSNKIVSTTAIELSVLVLNNFTFLVGLYTLIKIQIKIIIVNIKIVVFFIYIFYKTYKYIYNTIINNINNKIQV
jgi:hypothetical protein